MLDLDRVLVGKKIKYICLPCQRAELEETKAL